MEKTGSAGERLCGTMMAAGFLCLAAARFTPESTAVTGTLSLLGLFFFTAAARTAESRRARLMLFLLLWWGLGLRFSALLGQTLGSGLLVMGVILPVAALLSCVFRLERELRRGGRTALAVLCFPVGYTALMAGIEAVGFGNIPNVMTYLMCLPVFGQNMAWLSESAMTLLAAVLLSLAVEAFCGETKRTKMTAGALALCMSGGLLISGAVLAAGETPPDDTLRVAVATPEKMNMLGEHERDYTKEELREIFADAVKEAAEQQAELLVMSEEFFITDSAEEAADMAFFSETIRACGIPVLLPLEVDCGEGHKSRNEALYIDENGTVQASYEKSNLVPFLEAGDYERGGGEPACLTVTLGGREVKLAYLICFDLNSDALVRKIPADTELLLVPSWDWDSANLEQLRLRFRSVELHTTLLKHSYEGFTYVSTPYGESSTLDLRGRYETVALLEVPLWEK